MHVRGTALESILAAIAEEFGADGLATVLAALPPTARARLEVPVEPDAKYPIEISAALHEALRSELGGGRMDVNHRVGARAARADFGGIHRAFIRVADYGTLLRATERAWQRYNSHGRVAWPFIGDGEARGTIRFVRGFTEPMWEAIGGRLQTVLELGGAKDVSVRVEAWSETGTDYVLRWK